MFVCMFLLSVKTIIVDGNSLTCEQLLQLSKGQTRIEVSLTTIYIIIVIIVINIFKVA